MKKIIISFFSILLLTSFSVAQKAAKPDYVSISKIKYLSQYVVPYNQSYKGTVIGGLSGIDYDSSHRVYYLISDDRSKENAARYYTAKIFFTGRRIDTVQFVAVTTLLDASGQPYPNSKQDPAHTPDPEALRYDPVTRQMMWTSEGERIVNGNNNVLENPAITVITPGGQYIDTFPLPSNLLMHATDKGPRQNGTLEGLTFANHFKTMYVSLEEPLYEDGPRADFVENKPWIRIFKYDIATKKNTAQYAYKLDPVAHRTILAPAFKINGIPDILSIGDNKMLVLERSFSAGRMACTIKVFISDLSNATNIINNPSLKTNTDFIPVTKKLLLNMDDLGMYIDNIEGITFGPVLPNGHRTLLFVADNNFSLFEKTQFLLFEVIP
jgi:hypothetical protein